MKPAAPVFPDTIGVYVFIKTLKRLPSRSGDVYFALYQSPFGQKAFAKMVTKQRFHSAVPLLRKEAQYLQLLDTVQKQKMQQSSDLPIDIPKFVSFSETKTYALLLSTYSGGTILPETITEKETNVIENVFSYIHMLSDSMNEKQRQIFPQRTGKFFVFSYVFIFIKAWILHPEFRKLLGKSLLIFLQGIPSLWKMNTVAFAHRDIHRKNILRQDTQVHIIDFSYAAFTIPLYDYAVTLSSLWSEYSFRDSILEKITQISTESLLPDAYFRSILVYTVTLFLGGHNFSDRKKENYEQILSYLVHKTDSFDPSVFPLWKKIISIIPAYLHSSIRYASGKRNVADLPEQVGTYRLIDTLSSKKRYPYGVGVYVTPEGKEVIGKIWLGKHYSAHAYNLLHEASVYRILTTIQKRVNDSLPERFRNIHIPFFIDQIIQKDCIGLFMERAKGTPITDEADQLVAMQTYKHVRTFLKYLGDSATEEEQVEIGIKTKQYYLIVYPIIFLAAAIRHINRLLEIVLGVYSVFISLPYMTPDAVSLNHGDLHTDNILKDGDTITLVDLEQATFTYPEFDLAATLSSRRSTAEFRGYIKNEIELQSARRSFAERFAGIGAFISTFNLTSNLSAGHTAHYASVLKLSNYYSVNSRFHRGLQHMRTV